MNWTLLAASVLALGAGNGSLANRIRRLLTPPLRSRSFGFANLMVGFLVVGAIAGGVVMANWQSVQEQEVELPPQDGIQHQVDDLDRRDNLDRWDAQERWDRHEVVPDVSGIDDPEELVRQLEIGPRRAHPHEMMGEFRLLLEIRRGTPSYLVCWSRGVSQERLLDPRVQRLIELGDPARAVIHQQLLNTKFSIAIHLASVLRYIGDEASIELLIQLLERLDKHPTKSGMGPREIAMFAATDALWELTGQKHIFSPQQWQQWYAVVKNGYVVARKRNNRNLTPAQVTEIAQKLLRELSQDNAYMQDRFIAQGRLMVPHLVNALKIATSPESTLGASDNVVRLAWALDELGATSQIPTDVFRNYFAVRLATVSTEPRDAPDEVEMLHRVLNHCSFAEVCQGLITAVRMNSDAGIPLNIPLHNDMLRMRFQYDPMSIAHPIQQPLWYDVLPAPNPAQEIADAVPVLIAALSDENLAVRAYAAHLAGEIGICSTERPADLIIALRDAWLTEPDDHCRSEMALAMARYSTPLVLQSFSAGIRSDRPEIVRDAAGMFDTIRVTLNDETRADFELLKEFTRSEDASLRARSVRSLCNKAPELLLSELDRLVRDPDEEIQTSLSYMRFDDVHQEFIEAMFVLVADARQPIRWQAISALGRLNHPELIPRLRPLLHDEKVRGFALSAIVQSGGDQILMTLFDELSRGNDVGSMIYHYLKRLTGQSFKSEPEPWLDWWKQREL